MKKIYLSGELGKGKFVLVDNEDFEWLNQWRWHDDGKGYARRISRIGLRKFNKKKIILMHRLILNVPIGSITDHINGNTLDNRKVNLRIVNAQQNSFNKGVDSRSKLGLKGVGWHKDKKKYRAYIFTDGHQKHLGYFESKEDAIRTYNDVAKISRGEYARLNSL